jgi:hypothetical protein
VTPIRECQRGALTARPAAALTDTPQASRGKCGAGSTLVTQASWGGEALVVRVSEGSTLLLERIYDEEFLRSGRVDEFTVTSSTGQSRLYRYWASYDEDGQPRCAPLE